VVVPEGELKQVDEHGGGLPPWWARAALVASLAALGWLVMQGLHEAGHVLHALLSGATVERVELHPLRLSRTILGVNPHPRFVAWGGAVWGCLLPLLLVLGARPFGSACVPLARAVAGGCLLANGVYLGTGPFTHAGDAGDLLLAGASQASLVLFGLAASVGGLCLWNGIGERLASAARVREIGFLMAVLGVIAAIELVAAG
jgi:hypothetical protein